MKQEQDRMNEQIDRIAICELVQRERAARDMQRWDELAASYTEASEIDISWFHGTGNAFTEASRKMAGNGLRTFHQMGPTIVEIKGERALAETGCAIHAIGNFGSAGADVVSYSRLFERVQRVSGQWLIAGLQIVYIQDMVLPLNPSDVPRIDSADLAGYRTSYQFLSFMLTKAGHVPRTDLPGVDMPDTVTSLIRHNQDWLHKDR
jgi:SnoaL-like domain